MNEPLTEFEKRELERQTCADYMAELNEEWQTDQRELESQWYHDTLESGR